MIDNLFAILVFAGATFLLLVLLVHARRCALNNDSSKSYQHHRQNGPTSHDYIRSTRGPIMGHSSVRSDKKKPNKRNGSKKELSFNRGNS